MASTNKRTISRIIVLFVASAVFIVGVLVWQQSKIDPTDARFLAPSSNLQFIDSEQALSEYKQIVGEIGITAINPQITNPKYVKKSVLKQGVFDINPGKVWSMDSGMVEESYQTTLLNAEESSTKLIKAGWQSKTSTSDAKTLVEAAAERQKTLDFYIASSSAPDCVNNSDCRQRYDDYATRLNSKPLAVYFLLIKKPYELNIDIYGNLNDDKVTLDLKLQYTCTIDITCSNVLLQQ